MNKWLTYHIQALIIALLPLMQACTSAGDEPGAEPGDVVLSLSIASRAAEDKQIETSAPQDLKLWVFGQAAGVTEKANFVPLAYLQLSDPQFTGRDIQGNPIELIEQVIERGKLYDKLHFYVMLNSTSVEWSKDDNSQAPNWDANTTIQQLEEATFTAVTAGISDGNHVLMYGSGEVEITNKAHYDIDIPVTRAVGKLEFFVTKALEETRLTINSLKLEQMPDKGSMSEYFTPTDITYTGATPDDPNYLTQQKAIDTWLDANEPIGNFSQFEQTNFTPMPLSMPYLLPNPHGGQWAEVNGNDDYVYPSPTFQDAEIRYKLTVNYTLDGQNKDQVIYLPAIERNTICKIYARVYEQIILQCVVHEWNISNDHQLNFDYRDIVQQ